MNFQYIFHTKIFSPTFCQVSYGLLFHFRNNLAKINSTDDTFEFYGSLKNGLAELGRITQELEHASSDLESSLENMSISSSVDFDLEEKSNLCAITAVQSTLQTQMIIKDVSQAMDIHEKNMVSRAGFLSLRSQESFPKMNSRAVQRLSSTSD